MYDLKKRYDNTYCFNKNIKVHKINEVESLFSQFQHEKKN